MAKLTSEDDSGGLPAESVFRTDFPDLNLVDPEWEKLTPEERIGMAVQAEKTALTADKAIVNSEGSSFEQGRSRMALANTQGFMGAYEGTSAGLFCGPVAQSNGAMQR